MIVNKDENSNTSSVYIASLILKEFKKERRDKISIFNIASALQKYNIKHYRQIFFALALLYSTGIADFKEPYVQIVND